MRTREESLNNFCSAVDALIESKYLYVSRQATYLASLNYMPTESFDSLFKEYKN